MSTSDAYARVRELKAKRDRVGFDKLTDDEKIILVLGDA